MHARFVFPRVLPWAELFNAFGVSLAKTISLQARDIAQRFYAWHEEIGAAFDGDEAFQIVHARPQGIALHRHHLVAFGQMAHQRINFTAEPTEHRAINPCLLHELELALDVCVQADEVQPAALAVVDARVLRAVTVRAATPNQAVAIH